MAKGGDGRTEGRKDGHLEIPPCVLQDIGPLGPLPKKREISMTKGKKGEKSFVEGEKAVGKRSLDEARPSPLFRQTMAQGIT